MNIFMDLYSHNTAVQYTGDNKWFEYMIYILASFLNTKDIWCHTVPRGTSTLTEGVPQCMYRALPSQEIAIPYLRI